MKRKVRTQLAWLSLNASYSHGSFALPCLHAAAQPDSNLAWTEIAATIKDDPWRILTRLVETDPDLVAATAYLFNRELLLAALQRYAVLKPECCIVLGGPEFLGDNRAFLEDHLFVSAVFRGEADIALPTFLKVFEKPAAWNDLKGLCWIDSEGRYRDNGLAIAPVPLDDLPSPLDSAFYDTAKPFASIEMSRGCPSACAFCTSCRLGRPRYFGLPRVARDLERLEAAGVSEVRVLDRTFNLPVPRCIELLELMKRHAKTMRFHIEIDPAALTEDVLSVLSTCPDGMLHVEAGLQTGNSRALAAISRSADAEGAWHGINALCALKGIDTHVDLVAGLPQVTLPDIYADLKHLCEIGPAEIQLEILKLLPGTPLRDYAAEHGLQWSRQPPYEVLRTPGMSFANLNEVRILSRAVDTFYNDPDLRESTRLATGRDDTFWKRALMHVVDQRGEPIPLSRTRRFRILHRLSAELPGAKAAIECSWMAAGLGVRNGLVHTDLWKRDIPSAATCVRGDPSAPNRPSRIWHCTIEGREHWFVYSRERQRKRAAAVYRLP